MDDYHSKNLLVHGFVKSNYTHHSLLPICLIELMVQFYRNQQIFAIGKCNEEYIKFYKVDSNSIV